MADPNAQTAIDMAAARKATPFDVQAMNKMLNADYRDADMRRKVLEIIKKEKLLSKDQRSYLSRKDRLSRGLEISRRLFEIVDEHDLDYLEFLEALFLADENLGISLHEVAFQPVISSQGSDEQQAIWVPKCLNHEILGAYAQTELGHGSNVQRLETIATYIPETQEFDIHSPTVTATKWWIGGLGLLATHCVVQARLILKGKDLGPHLFICQIRDMETHEPLKGLEIGEIGPKVMGAFSALDNGFIRFDHFRVPRDQMLNRFAQVSPEGIYTKPPHDKLSYGGMIFIRSQMISNLGWSLAKAATIASRYTTVRRQFVDPEEVVTGEGAGKERQVITYPSVYMRILPVMARAYVFITAGKDMNNLFSEMSAQLLDGNTDLLAETHAVSSGLKAYVSGNVVEGCETVRRAMGGHGFLASAGIGRIYASQLPSVTYEGDNFILCLQVCRAALKTLRTLRAKKITVDQLSPSTAYLASLFTSTSLPSLNTTEGWLNPSTQTHLFNTRAAQHVQRLERLLESGKKWGDLSWECQNASKAIVESFLVRRMLVAVDGGLLSRGVGREEGEVVTGLIKFHNLYLISTSLGDFLEFGILASTPTKTTASLTSSPIELLRTTTDTLARSLLPSLIGLGDSFGFDDWDLDSSLGLKDGKVYEELLFRAKRDAVVNTGTKEEQREMYKRSVEPILKRGAALAKL